jgi:arylformamidase
MSEIVDLSHVIEPGVVTFPGLEPPRIDAIVTHETSHGRYDPGTEFHLGHIAMPANTGTYVDAPFHRFRDGVDLADLLLAALVDLPSVVVRVRRADDAPTSRAIEAHAFHDLDVAGRAVLFDTGWSERWGTPAYFGPYPYLTAAAAAALVAAGVRLVGIDSVNVDDGADGTRPVHTALLAAGIPVAEHLTNLSAVPDSGARFFAPALRVRGIGSLSTRAFAIIAGG